MKALIPNHPIIWVEKKAEEQKAKPEHPFYFVYWIITDTLLLVYSICKLCYMDEDVVSHYSFDPAQRAASTSEDSAVRKKKR